VPDLVATLASLVCHALPLEIVMVPTMTQG